MPPRACLCRQRIYPHLQVGRYPPMSPSGARIERRCEWHAVCWPLAWLLRYVPRFLVVAGRRAVAACPASVEGCSAVVQPKTKRVVISSAARQRACQFANERVACSVRYRSALCNVRRRCETSISAGNHLGQPATATYIASSSGSCIARRRQRLFWDEPGGHG